MKAYEIRKLSETEIKSKLEEKHEELFKLRFQSATSQLKNPNLLPHLKKDVARLETVLSERRLQKLENQE